MPTRYFVTTHAVRRILGIAVVALACGAAGVAQPFRLDLEDFPHVRYPDARFGEPHLVVYDDGVVLASASYRYSQRRHDSPWLVLTLSLAAAEALTLRREDIVLVRPDGVEVPPATGRERARDVEGVRRLLDERTDWPETLSFAFPRSRIDRGFHRFEFGVTRPDRVPDRVIRAEARGGVRGDVFFVSPDGSWRAGVHALMVAVGEARVVRLPILLR